MSTEIKQGVNVSGGNIQRGSDEVLKRWTHDRQQLSRNLLDVVAAIAEKHGGKVESVSLVADGDDVPRCGSVGVRFPFPHPHGGDPFGDLAKSGLSFHVFTHGIPIPDVLHVGVINPVVNPAQIAAGRAAGG
jgi:hypothetical protein